MSQQRFVGIDIGAETVKLVELRDEGAGLVWARRELIEHHKQPAVVIPEVLLRWDFDAVDGVAACGRLSRSFRVLRVPEQHARAKGFGFLRDERPATLVSMGCNGFSVLELRDGGQRVYRQNARCSQGTGNFLRQLVERFGLDIDEASRLCEDVVDPAPLSGRCPVILKTDLTHLANLGQEHARLVAGLFDAVAENVQVLLQPRSSPERVVLLGGVARSARIREHFRRFLERHQMNLEAFEPEEAIFCDAIGAAVVAAGEDAPPPALDALYVPLERAQLEFLPPPKTSLGRVRRLEAEPPPSPEERPCAELVLGLDIGSTGSKAVAIDLRDARCVWEHYTSTGGRPVQAAQRLVSAFLESPWARRPVLVLGATGSGREIVGSLLMTCFGAERVFVLNEIAAHAEGALSFDSRVDTIFEIGGQDAKYIRLDAARVVDAAMNEACSAGTGSFIEEQGRRFAEVDGVEALDALALSAERAVSLGQHCSVFMAEIIDEASGAGVERPAVVAGIYESVVQNYLNRVKGSRGVGSFVFCQGMPFCSDTLPAAVARQTGAEIIIPPNPGTIGALGIARLARREREVTAPGVELSRFLDARVLSKDHFVCKATSGCKEPGNKCRIERLVTLVEGDRRRFTWGGGCSLYDRASGRRKLPDGAPDPFRERDGLIGAIIERLPKPANGPTVAMTDEFNLKGLFPFFATLLSELGCRLRVLRHAGQDVLKRGIEEANVPFCAPMQLYHGIVATLADEEPDLLFLPMLLGIEPVRDEARSVLCPMVQAAPDLNRWDLRCRGRDGVEILSPVIDIQPGGLRSRVFVEACREIGERFGADANAFERAFERASETQTRFDTDLLELGRRALAYCRDEGQQAVVVLGRSYTIDNQVLNSNVPTVLREQGAVAIPVDALPVDEKVPVFEDIFWGYSQRNLRAAQQLRDMPGVYAVWCSNYACGPDSFSLHLFEYVMKGKPYAVIETDGHSGDAGTRTRIEAFLYCVREDLRKAREPDKSRCLRALEQRKAALADVRRRQETVLIPRLGPGARSLAACLRGVGIPAECLPVPTHQTSRLGRRYTSGKECVPMCITLGSLLERLGHGEGARGEGGDERFAFLMPTGRGPCRFGVYNLLHKIVIERLDLGSRVRVWSPSDNGYFEGIPGGIQALVFCGLMTADLLLAAHHDVAPSERNPGASKALYEHFADELDELMERAGAGDLSVGHALTEIGTGRFFGCADLLHRAAMAFQEIRVDRDLPRVLVVGEIYVRCDPFANDFVVDRLHAAGVRVRLAPFHEWLDYQEFINTKVGIPHDLGSWVSAKVQTFVQHATSRIMHEGMGWEPPSRAQASVEAAEPYLRHQLEGEAALTLGEALREWRTGDVDGVLSVAPLECMPSKIAESQLLHAAEQEGVFSLTLELNGDPVPEDLFEGFVFEVRQRFASRRAEPSQSGHSAQSRMRRVKAVAKDVFRGFPSPLNR